MNLSALQDALRRDGLDGWLFFDHHYRDPLAYRILGLSNQLHVSRRWYYFIPAHGEPRGLSHRIESSVLQGLPGEIQLYSSWQEQYSKLRALTAGAKRIAMQYSPRCSVVYVSLVDAGTIEIIRELGLDIVSSGDLIQEFEATWDDAKLQSHLDAGVLVDQVRRDAFALVRERLSNHARVTECEVRDFILTQFASNGLICDHSPIVGVNEHAGDPHFEPKPEIDRQITTNDLLLIDLWAKFDRPGAVYYDITWTAWCGSTPPDRIAHVFTIVRDARDAGVAAIEQKFARQETMRGYEVDDAVRNVIHRAGFGEFFIHRTGHSIGEEVHGAGANMDNLETHEERLVLPRTCFSIEPGIYLPDFGIRSEVDVFIAPSGPRVTGESQKELLTLS